MMVDFLGFSSVLKSTIHDVILAKLMLKLGLGDVKRLQKSSESPRKHSEISEYVRTIPISENLTTVKRKTVAGISKLRSN